MDVLKFSPSLSHKVRPGKQFHTIRRADKAISLGDRLQFAELENELVFRSLGYGACVGTADIELSDQAISVLFRQGVWGEKSENGVRQPRWTLPIDTPYGDGTWGITSFTSVRDSLEKFAVSEGFEDFARLICWFSGTYGLPFTGKLIVCEVDA